MKKQFTGTEFITFPYSIQIDTHIITGVVPVELMLLQYLRSCMDLIVPNLKDKITPQQQRLKSPHDKTARQCIIQQDDLLMVSRYNKKLRVSWLLRTAGQPYH